MKYTSNVIAEPSLRQTEYLKYHQNLSPDMLPPAPMIFEVEMEDPDIIAIEKSISFFVKRHESVRTIFPLIDGEIKQMILPDDDKRFSIEFIDTNTFQEPYLEIKNKCFGRAETMFADKHKGPLIKFLLFKLEGNKYEFFLLIDHIICDGWSIENIIKKELMMFYQCYLARIEPDIKPLKAHLRDYCEQQITWMREKREELSSFWKTKMSDYNDLFNISHFYDRYFLRNNKRRTVNQIVTQRELFEIYSNPQALLFTVTISGQRFNRIKKMAEINKCTISSIMYASLYIFLFCYTGKSKLLIAAIIADRFTSANQLIIGYLIGSAYFPREISDLHIVRDFINQTLYEILIGCQNIIISHDYLDLDDAKLQVTCDMLVNYIKHNSDLFQNAELNEMHIDTAGIYYPLECVVSEYEDGLVFCWKYNKLLFDKELIEDLVKCHEDILDFLTTNSDKTIGYIKDHFKLKET